MRNDVKWIKHERVRAWKILYKGPTRSAIELTSATTVSCPGSKVSRKNFEQFATSSASAIMSPAVSKVLFALLMIERVRLVEGA